MKKINKYLILSGVISCGAASAAAAFVQGGGSNLLGTLEPGLWQFKAVGGGAPATPVRQMCVKNQERLVQIQHGARDCEHYVVRGNAATMTVSYSCNGAGQGLTSIRKESARLIHIDSQGIHNNAPFSFTVEARRVAAC
ncbi:DUF3617 domain-containing protein [Sphingorhabdus arenilitoris]|uniref:DUF3617 domain-containing protein n=1 Tax=Sphingorhabdus arenilitoris TaxID=1490041 RepID=A0ABV8RH11_9SPHN